MWVSTLNDPDNKGCRALVAWATGGSVSNFNKTRQVGGLKTLEIIVLFEQSRCRITLHEIFKRVIRKPLRRTIVNGANFC